MILPPVATRRSRWRCGRRSRRTRRRRSARARSGCWAGRRSRGPSCSHAPPRSVLYRESLSRSVDVLCVRMHPLLVMAVWPPPRHAAGCATKMIFDTQALTFVVSSWVRDASLTGLARIARLGPVFVIGLRIPIRGPNVAHDSGQLCAICVPAPAIGVPRPGLGERRVWRRAAGLRPRRVHPRAVEPFSRPLLVLWEIPNEIYRDARNDVMICG
jgi:hypothetical protein